MTKLDIDNIMKARQVRANMFDKLSDIQITGIVRGNSTVQARIVRARLTKAKTIIESGEYSTLNEVAYSVGYDDPLYFSRLFKMHFGIAPSKL